MLWWLLSERAALRLSEEAVRGWLWDRHQLSQPQPHRPTLNRSVMTQRIAMFLISPGPTSCSVPLKVTEEKEECKIHQMKRKRRKGMWNLWKGQIGDLLKDEFFMRFRFMVEVSKSPQGEYAVRTLIINSLELSPKNVWVAILILRMHRYHITFRCGAICRAFGELPREIRWQLLERNCFR